MKREITNIIRYVMDEWIPPVIRDSRWFMYPAYYYWFKGKYIKEIMDFKKNVFQMSSGEYVAFYQKVRSRTEGRPTDMNAASLRHILKNTDAASETLLDVGCGKGYLLKTLLTEKNYKLTGCEIHNHLGDMNVDFVSGFAENLPFPDKSFDIVTCTHTIEHIINIQEAIKELKRVAKKQLIIVTPKQKYYFYTLDLHVWFFPAKEYLIKEIGLENYTCEDIKGDWVYVGYMD